MGRAPPPGRRIENGAIPARAGRRLESGAMPALSGGSCGSGARAGGSRGRAESVSFAPRLRGPATPAGERMTDASAELRERIENTFRFLAVDAVERAGSGHP